MGTIARGESRVRWGSSGRSVPNPPPPPPPAHGVGAPQQGQPRGRGQWLCWAGEAESWGTADKVPPPSPLQGRPWERYRTQQLWKAWGLRASPGRKGTPRQLQSVKRWGVQRRSRQRPTESHPAKGKQPRQGKEKQPAQEKEYQAFILSEGLPPVPAKLAGKICRGGVRGYGGIAPRQYQSGATPGISHGVG